MALGGLSPLIIFTFYKTIKTPNLLSSFIESETIRVPLVPIPLYLSERITQMQLDNYDRDISIDVLRDGVTAFERVSGDVVNLKFTMQKDNVVLTILTALIDRIIKTFDEQVAPQFEDRNYSMTIFYDNIFVLDASLERFHSSIVEGTDLREISFTFSKRSAKQETVKTNIIANTGTAAGINL